MTSSDRFDDDRLLQRYLDGELPAEAAAEFAAHMLVDGELRERVRVAEGLRAGFAATRMREQARPAMAPAGFTASVMAEVRRLPSREQLQQADVAESAVRLCRRLILAAAVLFGLGLAWQVGLFDRGLFGGRGADTLQAAPDEIRQELERLDALIEAGVPAAEAAADAPAVDGQPGARRGK